MDLNSGDAVVPSRPQRPRARDHAFVLCKRHGKLSHGKDSLNDVFRKTDSPDDPRNFKTILKHCISESRKSKSTFSIGNQAVEALAPRESVK